MFYQLLKRSVKFPHPSIKASYTKLTSEQVSKNGVLCRTSSFQTFSTADTLGKFSASDFSLDNIIEMGAFDMLKPVYAPDTNPLNVADQLEYQINNLNNVTTSQKETSKA